jgi:hypothetical protein
MRIIRAISAAALAALLGTGCGSSLRAPGTGSPLLASVQATTGSDSVRFLMQLTNTSAQPVVIHPEVEPGFVFTVERTGMPLWSSATDRPATPATRPDTLAPGDTRSFQASWKPPLGLRGDLAVTAALRDRRHPISRSARFRLP